MIKRTNAILLTLFGILLGGLLVYLSPTLKNPKLDIEFWAYLISTLIGLFALTFTIWQVRSTIKHNKLTNTPHLQLFHNISGPDLSIEVYIENRGLGPAVINDFHLYLDDTEIECEGADKVLMLIDGLFKDYKCTKIFSHFDLGSLLPAGEKQDIFKMEFENYLTGELMLIWEKINGRANIVINYSSIYGELKTLNDII